MMSTVGWKKDERVFGGDAANIVSLFQADRIASFTLTSPYRLQGFRWHITPT